jgi:hypothetical protein
MTAIKSLALLTTLLALAVAAGIGGCKVAGVDAHLHEMMLACAVCLVAACAAAAIALAQRGKLETAGMFQAALIGSVLHLGLVFIVGVAMVMVKHLATPFVLWLLAAYWATLIGLCVIFAKLIRSAPKSAAKGI